MVNSFMQRKLNFESSFGCEVHQSAPRNFSADPDATFN